MASTVLSFRNCMYNSVDNVICGDMSFARVEIFGSNRGIAEISFLNSRVSILCSNWTD
jgi:hypothetical protein